MTFTNQDRITLLKQTTIRWGIFQYPNIRLFTDGNMICRTELRAELSSSGIAAWQEGVWNEWAKKWPAGFVSLKRGRLLINVSKQRTVYYRWIGQALIDERYAKVFRGSASWLGLDRVPTGDSNVPFRVVFAGLMIGVVNPLCPTSKTGRYFDYPLATKPPTDEELYR